MISFFDNIINFEKKNTCFYSSLVYLINVLIASYYGYYLYAGLFFVLVITSLFHHTYYTHVTRIIDKIVIYLIVLYAVTLLYIKMNQLKTQSLTVKQYILFTFIIISFFLTNFLYYYGYLHSCLCFSTNNEEANMFHSFLHCVSSFGHCCVAVF